uniref:Uncharacterized protein n=1 Tax=Rhizophora mucronata TaxID=61149 RepID=A0A2P2IP68_RHIMU
MTHRATTHKCQNHSHFFLLLLKTPSSIGI